MAEHTRNIINAMGSLGMLVLLPREIAMFETLKSSNFGPIFTPIDSSSTGYYCVDPAELVYPPEVDSIVSMPRTVPSLLIFQYPGMPKWNYFLIRSPAYLAPEFLVA